MNVRCLVLTTLLGSSLLLAKGDERSVEDIREEAQEHFEKGYDKAAWGCANIGVGALQFSKGDLVGGALCVGNGVGKIRESIEEFKKSCDLFSDAREQDFSQCGDTYEQKDHDSWDVGY